MSRLQGAAAKLRAIIARRESEQRMNEEFQFHVDAETEANIRRGMTPDEARRAALLAFGGSDRHREHMRDERGARWLFDAWSDLRYALRTFRRTPSFALAATITLALGTGVNAIVFGTVNGLLFRPLPVPHPDRLVALYQVPATGQAMTLGFEEFADYRDQSGAFEDAAAQTGLPLNLQTDQGGDMVWGEMVTENFFRVLEMRPVLGRFFAPDAAAAGTNPFAVLSYASWKGRFNGDRDVIGKGIRLNGTRFTIIGVAPKGFHGTRKFGFWPEMWVPLGMRDVVSPGSGNLLRGRGGGWAIVVARVRAGQSLAATQAAASTFAKQLALAYPATNERVGALVVRAGSGFDNPSFAPPATMQLASSLGVFAVLLLLVVVCANLANLLLARAARRQQELAVRLSLGCSRARLVRQLLMEALVLALPGLTLGVGALFLTPVVQSYLVPHLQFRVGFDVSPDARVTIVTAAIGLLSVVLFGLAPALRASRAPALASLRANAGGMTVAGRPRMRGALVVVQLALSVVLLVGGSLFVRSLVAARHVDLGFDAADRVVLSVNPGLQGYDQQRGAAFYRGVLARVAALPNVASATWGFPIPFDTYGRGVRLFVDGITTRDNRGIGVPSSAVDVGFFETMGIRVADGRGFAAGDTSGAPLRLVVSRAAAARLWPGRSPLGQRARLGAIDGPEATVVGLVDDVKFNSPTESPDSHVYFSLRQQYRAWETLIVHVRGGAAERAIPAIRAVLSSADPGLPAFGAMTMDRGVDNALNAAQTAATMAGFFGLQALLIASIGLYGLVANIVAARTREIGVRMALGASEGRVLRFVLAGAGRVGVLGLTLGLAAAAGVTRLMRGFLIGLTPWDPATFVFVPCVLAVVVLLASYLPARRAARLDPTAALREG